MTTLQVLKKARALVARPYGWTRGAFNSVVSTPTHRRVQCYCADGAIRTASAGNADLRETTAEVFIRANRRQISGGLPVDRGSIWDWNDKKTRTQAQVVAAFDRAIAREQRRAA